MQNANCLLDTHIFHQEVIMHLITVVWQYYTQGSRRFGVSCPKIPPTHQPNIYFLTAWQQLLNMQFSFLQLHVQVQVSASSRVFFLFLGYLLLDWHWEDKSWQSQIYLTQKAVNKGADIGIETTVSNAGRVKYLCLNKSPDVNFIIHS